MKQQQCEVYDCHEEAEMCVQTRPEHKMYLCEYHVGEMIAIAVIRLQESEQEQEHN